MRFVGNRRALLNPHKIPSYRWPNAFNTGYSQTLTAGANNTLSVAGIHKNLYFTGPVSITNSNVTLLNSLVTSNPADNWAIEVVGSLSNVVIQNVTIIGAGIHSTTTFSASSPFGIYIPNDSQVLIKACNISQVGNGIILSDGQVTIQGNYVWGLNGPSGTHYDGVSFFGGGSSNFSLIVEGNWIENMQTQTDCLILQCYFGPVANVVVSNNALIVNRANGGYPLYLDAGYGTGGAVGATGYGFSNTSSVINNYFQRDIGLNNQHIYVDQGGYPNNQYQIYMQGNLDYVNGGAIEYDLFKTSNGSAVW